MRRGANDVERERAEGARGRSERGEAFVNSTIRNRMAGGEMS